MVIFGIIFLYCCVIFNPRRFGVMGKWIKRRAARTKDHFRLDMREGDYGVVEDQVDQVELSASLDDSGEQVLERKQYSDTAESMI